MDAEFEPNRWPGWVQFAIDFAMDGTIPPPEGRSMQADHWSTMSYTLFVNIVSWLSTDKWIDRTCWPPSPPSELRFQGGWGTMA
eukprot:6658991-Prymnesium_polylepis.1